MCVYSLFLVCNFLILAFCEFNDSVNTAYYYCTHPDCSLKNQHTLCYTEKKQSPRLYVSGMTTWMRHQILLLHNRHRDNIAMGLEPGQPPASNMRKLYWDYELEEMAEAWARQCQERHDECRNTIRFNVLQNMDVRPVAARVTEAQLLADAVGAWFSGSRVMPLEYVWSFRLGNCSSPGGCNAHWYSGAAWASTWRLGCSQALCSFKKRSCFRYRKRRTPTHPDEVDPHSNVTRTSTNQNILRRTKYMTTRPLQGLGQFPKTTINDFKESPLHRGLLDRAKRRKDHKESKIIAFTVCNYGPAGNIDGFPIYEAGPTCTNCPQGTLCGDHTHRALCASSGDPELTK